MLSMALRRLSSLFLEFSYFSVGVKSAARKIIDSPSMKSYLCMTAIERYFSRLEGQDLALKFVSMLV